MNALLERFRASGKYKTSLYALVAANFIPLGGVLFFGWRVGDIMVLFWLENVIIGIFNIVRMVIATGRGILGFFLRLPIIAFFTVHYGGFTLIHGIFVVVLFVAAPLDAPPPGHAALPPAWMEGMENPETLLDDVPGEMTDEEFDELLDHTCLALYEMIVTNGLWLAILALFISHGVSLRTNFIQSGEYLRVKADDLMLRPYGRIVILHLVIIVGAGLVVLTGQMMAALVLLILLKMAFDAGAHLHERAKLAKAAEKA